MYSWQSEDNVGKRARVLEERRTVILEQLGEGSDSALQESLLTEWLELVRERDRLLREEVEEVNERVKVECLVDLRRVLKDLGGLMFSQRVEDNSLRRDLASLYRQVDTFCTDNSIKAEDMEASQAAPMCLPPPPPPPPPMTMGATTLYKSSVASGKRKTDACDGGAPLDGQESGGEQDGPAQKKAKLAMTPRLSQQTPFRHESPLQSFNKHLISSISGGLVQRQLKRTVGARSPGGTPVRRERQLDASDPADAIALALQRKFRNTVVRSPLTPCDENQGDGSCVSDTFGSPVLEPSAAKRSAAAVPQLATASAGVSPSVKENHTTSLVNTL